MPSSNNTKYSIELTPTFEAKQQELHNRLDKQMETLMNMKIQVHKLTIRMENREFADILYDFIEFIHKKIISNATPTAEFPIPAESVLKSLRRPEELGKAEYYSDEEEYIDDRDLDIKARAFLKNISIEPDLILSMFRLTRGCDAFYGRDYHFNYDKRIKSKENQDALNKIKLKLQNITKKDHKAFIVKDDVINMIDTFIVVK